MPDDERKPERDLGTLFDLDRSTLIKNMVDRMETCMRHAQSAADDLKEVIADCREAELPARDISAIKKIARLRFKDKRAEAAEQIEALQRIGRAVGFDLFDWAATH